MPNAERYSWKGIEKDISPKALDSGGNRLLTPGTHVELTNGRLISTDGGFDGSIESLKGHTLINNGSLPAGTNTVVAYYEDVRNNTIIYFIHNSSNNHSIWRYTGSTGALTLLLQNSLLAFDGNPITGIALDEEVLYWTDNVNVPRKLDISALPYTSVDENSLTLMAIGPMSPPTAARATDANLHVNSIAENSFQFCYRFVYNNGEVSPLSPYSKTSPAETNPDIFTSANNTIGVDIAGISVLEGDVTYLIDRIEFLFRVGNSGDWKIFTSLTGFSDVAATLGVVFTNQEVHELIPTADIVIGNETIPSKATCLVMFKDRLFLNTKEIGLEVSGDYLAAGFVSTPSSQSLRAGLQWKEGGVYSVGIKFSDDYGNSSGVQPLYTQGIPYSLNANHTETETTTRDYLPLNFDGRTPPAWAKRCQIVVSRNQFQSIYAQCPANVLYYNRDTFDGDTIASGEWESVDGLVYLDTRPSNFGTSTAQFIHWQIPNNLAFVPTTDMFLTCKSESELQDLTAKIVDVRGDRVVTDNMDIDDWTGVNGHVFIEIFSVKEEKDGVYFEQGRDYDCSDGTFDAVGEDIGPSQGLKLIDEGDTHLVTLAGETNFKYSPLIKNYDYSPITYDSTMITKSSDAIVASPSPTLSNNTNSIVSGTITGQSLENQDGEVQFVQRGPNQPFLPVIQDEVTLEKNVTYTIDYNRIASHIGRAFVEQRRDGVANQPNKIRFSDPRIQDSNINGLSSFASINSVSLPNELSTVQILVPIGNNILLAIHERETTSMTVGEGFIKQGLADSILAKTESVVGDNRNLVGGFGTINPESVQAIEGIALWWDAHKGSFVRYASNGLFPVSDHGMKAYFKNKALGYASVMTTIKVIASIDRYHHEYIVTFPTAGSETQETWAFNYKENRWIYKIEDYPEYYARLNNLLFSFESGQIWKHNDSSTYNNFHGNQRTRSLKWYSNPNVTKAKRAFNIQVHGDQLAAVETGTTVVFRITTPEGQSSFVEIQEFDKEEGVYYGQILRDTNSPNIPAGQLALRHGDEMRGQYFTLELISDISDSPARLHSANFIWTDSEYSL